MKLVTKKPHTYKNLELWKIGVDIADLVYEITQTLPDHERWSLGSHMQQWALSISSHIGSGFSKNTSQSYREACSSALASCCELEACLILADRRHYLSAGIFYQVQQLLEEEKELLLEVIQDLCEEGCEV